MSDQDLARQAAAEVFSMRNAGEKVHLTRGELEFLLRSVIAAALSSPDQSRREKALEEAARVCDAYAGAMLKQVKRHEKKGRYESAEEATAKAQNAIKTAKTLRAPKTSEPTPTESQEKE